MCNVHFLSFDSRHQWRWTVQSCWRKLQGPEAPHINDRWVSEGAFYPVQLPWGTCNEFPGVISPLIHKARGCVSASFSFDIFVLLLNQSPPCHLLLGLCPMQKKKPKTNSSSFPDFHLCLPARPDFPYYLAGIHSDGEIALSFPLLCARSHRYLASLCSVFRMTTNLSHHSTLPKTSTSAKSCFRLLLAALLHWQTVSQHENRRAPRPGHFCRWATVLSRCTHLHSQECLSTLCCRRRQKVSTRWINACVTAVVRLRHKALHSQSHRAYNSSQWVGEASFKPWRKSSYLPTPPPFLSLTHRHGQGPIREGCSIQYASHIALEHKQMEFHLSNVGETTQQKDAW